MASRGKGVTSLEAPKVQTPVNLPPPPPPPPLPPVDQGPRANPDVKKKRPIQELEEAEMLLQKGVKQQKVKDHHDKSQTLWRAETMSRSAVRSAHGLL